MARTALVSALTICSTTPLDAGYGTVVRSLMPSHSQMWRVSPIDNSRVLSVMISRILLPDSFSAAAALHIAHECSYPRRRGCTTWIPFLLLYLPSRIRPLTHCLLIHASNSISCTSYIVDSILISLNLDLNFTLLASTHQREVYSRFETSARPSIVAALFISYNSSQLYYHDLQAVHMKTMNTIFVTRNETSALDPARRVIFTKKKTPVYQAHTLTHSPPVEKREREEWSGGVGPRSGPTTATAFFGQRVPHRPTGRDAIFIRNTIIYYHKSLKSLYHEPPPAGRPASLQCAV